MTALDIARQALAERDHELLNAKLEGIRLARENIVFADDLKQADLILIGLAAELIVRGAPASSQRPC